MTDIVDSISAAHRVLDDPETGIWGRGTGWDMGLHALDAYLGGRMPDVSAAEFELTPEIGRLADEFGRAWAAVVRAERR